MDSVNIPKGWWKMLKLNSPRLSTFSLLASLCALLLVCPALMLAQTTLSTGSVVGTVTDPSGALVNDAKIVVTNIATNQKVELTSNASGAFSTGPLSPGSYKVQVSAKGFNTIVESIVVQVGNTVGGERETRRRTREHGRRCARLDGICEHGAGHGPRCFDLCAD